MVGQRQVAQHHRPAPHGAMGTNARTASHPHATGHGGVGTNVHVVADLNQVVEFDTIFNHGVVQRAAVYARVGSDFHIVTNAHRSELFNFFPLPLVQGKTKTVSADHDARMQDATLANRAPVRQRHTGLEHRARSDPGTTLDHTHRADDGVFGHPCVRVNDRCRVDTGA